ncbi:MAG: dephospho-CoA kinase [Rickettsiales bacterium]|nr:dephospho-CoA kinase [Rickettsiales bacterium]
MIIVGITGSVASGKNFITKIFEKYSFVIFDADLEISNILLEKEAIRKINDCFPELNNSESINKKLLAEIVFSNKEKLRLLEEITHPALHQKYQNFIKKCEIDKKKFIALNIPLLIEKNNYKCSKIVSAICNYELQKRRFISREILKFKYQNHKNKIGKQKLKELILFFKEKFDKIVENQLNNRKRIISSDFTINTSKSRINTIKQTKKIIRKIIAEN